nr:reverse transcriptase domain-containing protein [Tanacetum cinerariifolium]
MVVEWFLPLHHSSSSACLLQSIIQLPPTGHNAHVEDIVVSGTAIVRIFLYQGLCNLPGSGFTFLLAVASFFTGSGKLFCQWELYNWQWECLVHFIPNKILIWMCTRASNFELVEPLPEPECTLNQRLRRRNRRVPFDQRNNSPQHSRIVYPPILDINYFHHILDILRNYNPINDETMWAADRVVAPTTGFTITIPETVNEFAIKDFVILKMEEDSKVPLILGRPFLYTIDAVIRIKQKKLNFGVGTERMIFNIDSAIKHSYSNDDTCLSIDVIGEILVEDFDALLDEGSEILLEGTILEEKIFAEFDEFMAMTADENLEFESDPEEPPFEKITLNNDYKIKTSLVEPPTNLELKPLPNNLEYTFLEEPSFLPVTISS